MAGASPFRVLGHRGFPDPPQHRGRLRASPLGYKRGLEGGVFSFGSSGSSLHLPIHVNDGPAHRFGRISRYSEEEKRVSGDQRRAMLRQILPGMVLPGTIYFLCTLGFGLGIIPALAFASGVPLIDVLSRLVRGKAPTAASLLFVVIAGFSVSLAVISGSPMFILLKGAVISVVLGVAFAVSAAMNRPLTRTFAVRLAGECAESRKTLNERWRHPKALDIFKVLSFGWAILLLLSAAQQIGLAFTLSPGTVVALEGPITTGATAIGVAASVLYVRRFRHSHPELGLLPVRSA